ncbi:MAG: hypothetical protein GQ557_01135 [Mycoplasmataceae bacterium]|nr:hypothetical protein [Mycoplasmataceae bacterium]
MEQKNIPNKPYFYIDSDRIVYPAATWKRVFARFFDLLMINLILTLFFAIYYSTMSIDLTLNLNEQNFLYTDFVPPFYQWFFMLLYSLAIAIIVFNCLIFPLLNKKNPGQTLGKRLMNITPIYFKNKGKKQVIIRELPLTLIFIFPLIILLLIGGIPSFYYQQYKQWTLGLEGLEKIPDGITNTPLPEFNSLYDFFQNGVTSKWLMGDQAISGFHASLLYFYNFAIGFYYIFVLALFISIVFSQKKIGIIDKIVKTSIVDLKTIIERDLVEDSHNPEQLLTPTPTKINEPPVELET